MDDLSETEPSTAAAAAASSKGMGKGRGRGGAGRNQGRKSQTAKNIEAGIQSTLNFTATPAQASPPSTPNEPLHQPSSSKQLPPSKPSSCEVCETSEVIQDAIGEWLIKSLGRLINDCMQPPPTAGFGPVVFGSVVHSRRSDSHKELHRIKPELLNQPKSAKRISCMQMKRLPTNAELLTLARPPAPPPLPPPLTPHFPPKPPPCDAAFALKVWKESQVITKLRGVGVSHLVLASSPCTIVAYTSG